MESFKTSRYLNIGTNPLPQDVARHLAELRGEALIEGRGGDLARATPQERREFEDSVRLGESMSIILVQNQNNEYIGCAELNDGVFGRAYVRPAYRRKGVFGKIVDEVYEVAQDLGLPEICARPGDNNKIGKVLEEKGYRFLPLDIEEGITYVKYVEPRDVEREGSHGTPDRKG